MLFETNDIYDYFMQLIRMAYGVHVSKKKIMKSIKSINQKYILFRPYKTLIFSLSTNTIKSDKKIY